MAEQGDTQVKVTVTIYAWHFMFDDDLVKMKLYCMFDDDLVKMKLYEPEGRN